MNASYTFLLNHLLQSTVFAAAAATLAFSLRNNGADVRFRIWLAASVKFLIPFSWIVGAGRTVKLPPSAVSATPVLRAAERLEHSFTLSPDPLSSAHTGLSLGAVLLAFWAIGAFLVLFRWAAAWLRMRRIARSSSQITMNFPTPVRVSGTLIEPGIFGIVRPVLLLPVELTRSFQQAELDSILAHELCHVRRRDNLIAALHMVIQALFWFHPALWFIGSKLLEERELACDQEVLRAGNSAESYAGGILRVCRLCLEPAGMCTAGVSGADLRWRIEAILSGSISNRLSGWRRILVGLVAAVAIAGPIAFGILQTQLVRAQQPPKLQFEVATIKPSSPASEGARFFFQPGGKLSIANRTLRDIIANTYQVREFQVTGGPSWIDSDHFDIEAKIGEPGPEPDLRKMTQDQRELFRTRFLERVQSLLADRFQLRIREEEREMPIYALVVAKSGAQLKPATKTDGAMGIRGGRGQLEGISSQMIDFAKVLAANVGRPVIDKTGLEGMYNWKLIWTPEQSVAEAPRAAPSDVSGASLFTALQDQLGLRLESQKAPARMIIVESASKPSAN